MILHAEGARVLCYLNGIYRIQEKLLVLKHHDINIYLSFQVLDHYKKFN